jgi:hypothetical protein
MRWLARPILALIVAAGCSPAMPKRQARVSQAEIQKKAKAGDIEYPNADLAEKHKAAKASPESYAAVYPYARSVTEFCLASLYETDCETCKDGAVKRKPPSELDPKTWVLVENAKQMLDTLLKQDLPAEQAEEVVITKGRLQWLAGSAADEEASLDGYLQEHPDSLAVLKRRLRLLREAGNATAAQAACAHSREGMKSAPEAARLDLLTTCVALHPDNRDGMPDSPEYTTYLPDLSKAEARLYLKYLVHRCIENLGDPKAKCEKDCDCKSESADKAQKRACKRACRNCQKERKALVRACKKHGGILPPPPPEAAPASQPAKDSGKGAPGSEPQPVDPASAPKQQVL